VYALMGRPPSKAERGAQERRSHNSAVRAAAQTLTPSQKREKEKEARRHAERTKGYHDAEAEKQARLAAERRAAEGGGTPVGLAERRKHKEELARKALAAGVSLELLALQKKELQRLKACSVRALREEARGLALAEELITATIGATRASVLPLVSEQFCAPDLPTCREQQVCCNI
jgi:IS5 family transposase